MSADPWLARVTRALLLTQTICAIGIVVSWAIGDAAWLWVSSALAITTGFVAVIGALIGESE